MDKYVVAVHMAGAYIMRRFVKEHSALIKCYRNLNRRHRDEHAEVWLKAAVGMAQQDKTTIDQALQRFLSREPEMD